jgi:hypothetical protein
LNPNYAWIIIGWFRTSLFCRPDKLNIGPCGDYKKSILILIMSKQLCILIINKNTHEFRGIKHVGEKACFEVLWKTNIFVFIKKNLGKVCFFFVELAQPENAEKQTKMYVSFHSMKYQDGRVVIPLTKQRGMSCRLDGED